MQHLIAEFDNVFFWSPVCLWNFFLSQISLFFSFAVMCAIGEYFASISFPFLSYVWLLLADICKYFPFFSWRYFSPIVIHYPQHLEPVAISQVSGAACVFPSAWTISRLDVLLNNF